MCELCDIDGCDCSDQPVNWSSVDDVDSSGVPVSANGVAPTVADAEGLDSTLSWSGTTVTFAFPAAAEDFSIGSYYSAYNEPGSMLALSDFGKDVLREAFAYWDDLIGLNIVEADAGDLAQISVGASTAPSTAWAYYPGSFTANGDIWLNTSAWYLDALSSPEEPVIGSYAYATSMHEIGHALGLKHAHQASTGNSTVLDEAYDALEYTIMSYRSFAGAGTGGYTVETWGYPQSPMMLDIAMIQQIYGADFTTLSGDTTYTVSATTGEFFIDGVSQGVPGANRVFRTLWDGDGEDHIDLSNYTTDLLINLTPGEGIDLDVNSTAQTSRLGTNDDGDTVYAGYNIYMSLLYENDTRSLIENATGGTGNDTLIGNDADNTLTGGGGNDTFIGGLGADLLVLGTGMDTVSGTLAELDGDTIVGFDATYDQIKIENATLGMVTALVSNGQLILTNGTETATLELNGLTDEFDVIELAQQNTAVGLVFQNSSAPVAPESPVIEAETLLTDSIAAYTAAGLTVVTASDAGETINGSGNGSVLQGGLGDDRLREDAGNDVMYGGDGADQFIWDMRSRTGSEADVLLDLDFASGDKLRVMTSDGSVWLTSDEDIEDAVESGMLQAGVSDDGNMLLSVVGIEDRTLEVYATSSAAPKDTISTAHDHGTPETLLTDSIAAYTAAGLTVVTASDAGETINGSGNGSVLQGGLGDDRLREDAGNDVMYGGDGADQFIWDMRSRTGSEADVLLDLDFASGDKLRVMTSDGSVWLTSDEDIQSAVESGMLQAGVSDYGNTLLSVVGIEDRTLELVFYEDPFGLA